MLKIAIIIGSTRPQRIGGEVARWVFKTAENHGQAEFELVDLLDINLPLLDEQVPPSQHNYSKAHTKKWSDIIARFDAFVFVTAEYNHGIPGALKNAIDFLYTEWNNKAAGFVSYGSAGGTRAVEQLRLVMAEMQVACVREQLMLSLSTDFENYTVLKPTERHVKILNKVLDQVIQWGRALKDMREMEIEVGVKTSIH